MTSKQTAILGEISTKLFLVISILSYSSQVMIFPPGITVSVLHGSFQILCDPVGTEITSVQWLVNGVPLENLNLDATAEFSENGGGLGVLSFNNGLQRELNGSVFKCIAVTSTSEMVASTDSAKLLLQGYLAAVGSLTYNVHDFSIFLTWTPPFSLDITGVPDIIEYCVRIEEEDINVSEEFSCRSEPGYNTTLPYESVCYTYNITVYAVNLVGNGAKNNQVYDENETSPEVMSPPERLSVTPVSSTAKDVFTYKLVVSDEVCGPVELSFVDLNAGDSITLNNTFLNVTNGNIIFTTENLTVHRHYNITVDINNGSTVSQTNMSTHGILSVMTNSSFHMKIAYYNHSNTKGALLNVVFITDDRDIDFTKSALLPLVKEHHSNKMLSHHSGRHKIYGYDIEYDGTLPSGVGYPAVSTGEIPIDFENLPPQRFCIKNCSSCDILSPSKTITVQCRLRNDSMAIGIQVIAQLNDINEVHKLYVNQSTGLQTPVTVQVETNGKYQVSILAIREGMGILDSTVEYASMVTVGNESGPNLRLGLGLGLGLPISVLIIIVLLVIVIAAIKKLRPNL